MAFDTSLLDHKINIHNPEHGHPIVDLVKHLESLVGQQHDILVPAQSITAYNGKLIVANGYGADSVFTDLVVRPSETMLSGISKKIIKGQGTDAEPGLRWMRMLHNLEGEYAGSQAEGRGLITAWDKIVNEFLAIRASQGADFRLRCYIDPDDREADAYGRALLSNAYKFRDNYGLALGLADSLSELYKTDEDGEPIIDPQTGQPVPMQIDVTRLDVSETNLRMMLHTPDIELLAPRLLEGYVSPFGVTDRHGEFRQGGVEGKDLRVVQAGFQIWNSETGNGRLKARPVLRVPICDNGCEIDLGLKFGGNHTGKKESSEGLAVVMGQDTLDAQIQYERLHCRDMVKTLLTPETAQKALDKLLKVSEVEIASGQPEKVVEVIAEKCHYSESEAQRILSHFTMGGQTQKAGGIIQAVTSASQTLKSADRAQHLDATALHAGEVAAKAFAAA